MHFPSPFFYMCGIENIAQPSLLLLQPYRRTVLKGSVRSLWQRAQISEACRASATVSSPSCHNSLQGSSYLLMTAPLAESWSLDRFCHTFMLTTLDFRHAFHLPSLFLSDAAGHLELAHFSLLFMMCHPWPGISLRVPPVVLQCLHFVREMFAATRHEWHFPTKLSPSLLFQSCALQIL